MSSFEYTQIKGDLTQKKTLVPMKSANGMKEGQWLQQGRHQGRTFVVNSNKVRPWNICVCIQNQSVFLYWKTALLKFKERMRSIIKPFQNHNRIKNGAIFTANIHEGRHGRKNPEWHYLHEKCSGKWVCHLLCKIACNGA